MPTTDYVYFFPADPLGAKPDWPRLRARLLSSGIFAEREGQRGPDYSLFALWTKIAEDRGLQPLDRMETIETVGEFVGRLAAANILPPELRAEGDRTGVPELIARLRSSGLIPLDFPVPFSEGLACGPRFSTLFDVPDNTSATEISYDDYGDGVAIFAGRDLLAQPVIPGTDRVVEKGIDLITRWYEDQTTRWTDPETGRSYGLLDLDWENTLGAGQCGLEIKYAGRLNAVRLADLLSDFSGLPFRFAFVYL